MNKIEEIEKGFDEKFVIAKLAEKHAVAKLSRDQSELVKHFYRQAFSSLIEELEGEVNEMPEYTKQLDKSKVLIDKVNLLSLLQSYKIKE